VGRAQRRHAIFTGLIESTGSVISIAETPGARRITVALPQPLASRLKTGDSISVSGVCLTALDIVATGEPRFSADLATETVERTSLSRLAPGSMVNLELPTPAGAPLGGHIVQGHVDGVAKVLALVPLVPGAPEATDWALQLGVPDELTPYIVEKGSITVEGVSLTVAKFATHIVTIAIIPHTYAATNLRALREGDEVNIEVDVLAKYAEQQAKAATESDFEVTLEYLIANGY
jgi:riboflavin synthase